MPGVDYNVGFDVPVLRTPESDTPLSAEEIAWLDPSALPTASAWGLVVTLLLLTSTILGIPLGAREIDGADVSRVEPEPGFRSGTDITGDLALWQNHQRKVILGRTIPTRGEAEWLATEILKILSPSKS